ncbi:MAG TPA: helix-turn-helix transcriptional regulator [Terracidiphilus sp.]|nr:helix-turn-helix transcriptional regulator [Terracidiphilus sp.]
MSKKRQTAVFDPLPRGSAAILTLSRDYAAGHRIPSHFHDRDQLVFASRGVMTVTANTCAWVVPVHRAVWIPANTPHSIAMSGNVAMRTLYLKPRLAESLPRECCVVNVSALLRELILQACRCGSLGRRVVWQSHLVEVILDQLRAIKVAPLQLSLPEDSRALRVAEALLEDPSDPRPLKQIARTCGASRRTIERLFVAETGTTFGKWRQQLRLMQALRLLGGGSKVTHAALEAGYSTSSSFIAAFRKTLGSTPTRYFRGPSGG